MFRPSDSCKGQPPQHRMKPDLRRSDNNRHTNSLGEISGASGQSLRATATEEGLTWAAHKDLPLSPAR